ncbi:hypothetical protein [Peribacillus asahii]|uniref:hypothetical protein n=1 Tax=Peribacillus asahii TaxID=228899 RepID=UPI002079E43D|nr:hypothetical protein [Peribacillus asahii]USK87547.1 hypothetical protein LIT35_23725 [Peribacillus asahii]
MLTKFVWFIQLIGEDERFEGKTAPYPVRKVFGCSDIIGNPFPITEGHRIVC